MFPLDRNALSVYKSLNLLQTPEELGDFTQAVHIHALSPLHEETSKLFALLRELPLTCQDVLRLGSRADRDAKIQDMVQQVEDAR